MSRVLRVVVLSLAFVASAALETLAQGLPGAPINVLAEADGTRLLMSWQPPVTGGAPESFVVIGRLSPNSPPAAVIPMEDYLTFVTEAPIVPGSYWLSVAAVNRTGQGPESTVVRVDVPGVPTLPNQPVGLSVRASGNTATFEWEPPASGGVPAQYYLHASTSPGGPVVATLPVSHRFNGSAIVGVPTGTYWAYLTATNGAGSSLPSNQVQIRVTGPSVPTPPALGATAVGSTLNVTWTPGNSGAASYTLIASLTPGGTPIALLPLTGTSASFPNVPDGAYYLRMTASNAFGTGLASNEVYVVLPASATPLTQRGTDITDVTGGFGARVALNADGTRMIVGSIGSTNGTARVYQWNGATWTQLGQALNGEASGDRFGSAVAINDVGDRIAVGGYLNDGAGTNTGHVRVFDLAGGSWVQVGADIDGTGASGSGREIALSTTGNRLVVGAPAVNGTGGSARIYDWQGSAWVQVGNTLAGGNQFGDAVAISGDGNVVAVSAPSGVGGSAGSVSIYRLSAATWNRVSTGLGQQVGELFGDTIALDNTGARIVVGASSWDNPAGSNLAYGQVRVFNLVGSAWQQVGGSITGINREALGGGAVAISGDGRRIAMTAASYSQSRVFSLINNAWVQTGPSITPPSGGTSGRADGTALSRDGSVVAVGFTAGSPRRVRVYTVAP